MSTSSPLLISGRKSDRTGVAAVMLVLATVMWGCGFTFAKAGGEAINRLTGEPTGSPIGPTLLVAVRFVASAGLWFLCVPATRRGWTRRVVFRASVVGLILSFAILVQHLGLDRTTEAVSAFLTSLTIVFVPLLQVILTRRLPTFTLLSGTILAAVGVYLLLGARFDQFGWGEGLGLMCAAGWSVYILVVNAWSPGENPWRFVSIQFLVTGIVTTAICPLLPGGTRALSNVIPILLHPGVLGNAIVMTIFPTALAFALLNKYQPMLDPTRASLLYMVEPVVATLFAWAFVPGRAQAPVALVGAGLILAANLIVELFGAHRKTER